MDIIILSVTIVPSRKFGCAYVVTMSDSSTYSTPVWSRQFIPFLSTPSIAESNAPAGEVAA